MGQNRLLNVKLQLIQRLMAASDKLQVFRYFFTGLIAFVTDYSIFLILYQLTSIGLYISNSLALLSGFLVSFTLNKLWVFTAKPVEQEQRYPLSAQILLYALLLAFNSVFAYFFILALVKVGLHAYIAKLGSTILIMLWNFIVYKKIIFKQK